MRGVDETGGEEMSWLPEREKLDAQQGSAIDFVATQDGNYFIRGEAGAGKS